MNPLSIGSLEKYGFSLYPLTLKVPEVSLHTSTTLYEKTCVTLKGPNHLNLSVPANSFNLELKSKTKSPSLISLVVMCLSCQLLVLSLKILCFHRHLA